MKRRCLLIICYLLIILAACNKDDVVGIDFQAPANSYSLIVEGGITTLQKTQYIKLTEPAFKPEAMPAPVRTAQVFVNDGQKDIPFKETSTPGLYSGVVSNNTNYNQAYKLIVRYKNKEYTAVDTLRQVINIVDDFLPLAAVKQADATFDLNIPKHTFGFINSSKWVIVYRDVPPFNPSKFDGTMSYSYTHTLGAPNSIYPLINQSKKVNLSADDVVSIYKLSLSEQYARYLYAVFQETDWKGIFSSVPGKINGNISGDAEGYFYATDIDVRKYKVKELAN